MWSKTKQDLIKTFKNKREVEEYAGSGKSFKIFCTGKRQLLLFSEKNSKHPKYSSRQWFMKFLVLKIRIFVRSNLVIVTCLNISVFHFSFSFFISIFHFDFHKLRERNVRIFHTTKNFRSSHFFSKSVISFSTIQSTDTSPILF